MKSVYKYPIPWPPTRDEFTLALPVGAEILCFQMQGETPCIWALVDTGNVSQETRKFRLAGTGHPIEYTPKKYIGTIQLRGGLLIFHLFEL